jgi:hypothetical protein
LHVNHSLLAGLSNFDAHVDVVPAKHRKDRRHVKRALCNKN